MKELFRANQNAKETIRDLCYGNGYVLIDGQMRQTGMCTQNTILEEYKGKYPKTTDATTSDGYRGKCMSRQGETYVKAPSGTMNFTAGGKNA